MIIQKKICLLGDFAVGKTSLIRRFVHNEFSENYLTTIGVHISKKEISLESGSLVLIIWDLAGNDGFQRTAASYMVGAAGAIFVGDLSRSETINSLPSQISSFKSANPDASFVVALNKTDLMPHPVDANEIASKAGLPDGLSIFLTSCKIGENVEDVFSSLAGLIMER